MSLACAYGGPTPLLRHLCLRSFLKAGTPCLRMVVVPLGPSVGFCVCCLELACCFLQFVWHWLDYFRGSPSSSVGTLARNRALLSLVPVFSLSTLLYS